MTQYFVKWPRDEYRPNQSTLLCDAPAVAVLSISREYLLLLNPTNVAVGSPGAEPADLRDARSQRNFDESNPEETDVYRVERDRCAKFNDASAVH